MTEQPDDGVKALIEGLFGALTVSLKKLKVQPFVFVVVIGLVLIVALLIAFWAATALGDVLGPIVKIVIIVVAALAFVALFGYFLFELRSSSSAAKTVERPDGEKPAPAIAKPSEEPAPTTVQISFRNREDEMDTILSSFSPAYHLLDAPAGYGKTWLLKELRRRFDEKGWLCAYASTNDHKTMPAIAGACAADLRVKLTSALEQQELGSGLAAALREQRMADLTHQGLVLLIDLDGEPVVSLLQPLLTSFIPSVQSSLRDLEFFANKHNRFRAVIAGRYLARSAAVADAPFRLKSYQLTPFKYGYVREAAREYLVGFEQDRVSEIAAHVMVLTGGHPGCMARVLDLYRAQPGANVGSQERFRERIWRTIVQPVVNDVRAGIPQERRHLLDEISVFRGLDYPALRHLISGDEPQVPGYSSEQELAFDLTSSYLLTWRGRFLRDDITRRLLAIWLRQERGNAEFAACCKKVQLLCAQRLQESNTQQPEIWAIEYLFQFLQARIQPALGSTAKKALRQGFFDQEVSRALELLCTGGRKVHEEKQALVQSLEDDWEFRLVLNYVLGVGRYSEEPFERLIQRVGQWSPV